MVIQRITSEVGAADLLELGSTGNLWNLQEKIQDRPIGWR